MYYKHDGSNFPLLWFFLSVCTILYRDHTFCVFSENYKGISCMGFGPVNSD
jgi:hypothetical protein